MRLLVCTANRGIPGGVETYLRAILPRLGEAGFRVGLVFENDAGAGPGIDGGVGLERVWQVTVGNRAEVLAAIQDWGPAVVYNNGLADVGFELSLARYPAVYFAHNYVGTCISGYKRQGSPSPEPCFRTFGPACLAQFYPRRCGGLNPVTMFKGYFANARRLAMLRLCTRLQVASKAMRMEYLRHGLAEVQVVLNPLFPANAVGDLDVPARRDISGTILLAGRLTELKGCDYLIRALHLARQTGGAPPLHLSVAGDGPELPRLRALACSLGVSATFHGWVDGARLEALLRSADLLAMPSLWPEPFGLLGIEAGCYGVPSVGFAHGGITDWLVEGKSGTLAPSPPTVEGLAQAIGRAVSDADTHHGLRLGAWETSKQFSIEKHLRRLNELLFAAASQPSGGKR